MWNSSAACRRSLPTISGTRGRGWHWCGGVGWSGSQRIRPSLTYLTIWSKWNLSWSAYMRGRIWFVSFILLQSRQLKKVVIERSFFAEINFRSAAKYCFTTVTRQLTVERTILQNPESWILKTTRKSLRIAFANWCGARDCPVVNVPRKRFTLCFQRCHLVLKCIFSLCLEN